MITRHYIILTLCPLLAICTMISLTGCFGEFFGYTYDLENCYLQLNEVGENTFIPVCPRCGHEMKDKAIVDPVHNGFHWKSNFSEKYDINISAD